VLPETVENVIPILYTNVERQMERHSFIA